MSTTGLRGYSPSLVQANTASAAPNPGPPESRPAPAASGRPNEAEDWRRPGGCRLTVEANDLGQAGSAQVSELSELVGTASVRPASPVSVKPRGSAGGVSSRTIHRASNRIAVAYLSFAGLLLPWLVMLAFTLPDRQLSQNYRLAWVGFDLMLMITLSRTGWLAWRRSPYLVIVASMTATLLVIDAWFDVTTAGSDRERYLAIAAALCVELPLACFSMRLARRAQRMIAEAAELFR